LISSNSSCPFVLFLSVIVLSVLLRYTNSDYLPLVSSNWSWIIKKIYVLKINCLECANDLIGLEQAFNVPRASLECGVERGFNHWWGRTKTIIII
jgi:hypothetical protein